MSCSDYSLRSATSKDIWPIRRLVFSAGLEPTQLRWQQFWVAQGADGVIACCQLRTFVGAQELGSLVVAKPYRHQGIGHALSDHVIAQAIRPLYLECLGQKLVSFYESLGFVKTEVEALPDDLQRKFMMTARIARLFRLPLYWMQYQPQPEKSSSY